ncbi:Uncharacterised protein [Xylophilus ampelinus]|nr:Uncharacterised protein [Xylophilus ampelinus]
MHPFHDPHSFDPSRATSERAEPQTPCTDRSWRYALSADRQWALVCDAEGRNLAEIHRPAVTTGPFGRTRTFEEVVGLMAAGPDLVDLLDGLARSGQLSADAQSQVHALLLCMRRPE